MNRADISPTLEVYAGERLVFSSEGRWLHPIFELERFMEREQIPAARLHAHDKVVGRAAALLFVHLGVGHVHGRLLSYGAREVFEHHTFAHSWEALVERIACRTETLLAEEFDPEAAYALLRARAEAAG